jgi:hemolysin activation/secretion protein
MCAALVGSSVVSGAAHSVRAQTASQIAPTILRNQPQAPGGGFFLSGAASSDVPAGAEKLTIRLSGVELVNPLPEMGHEAEALRRRLTGRTIPVAEIFAAARDLEAAYARAGYVLVRVVVPAQKLANGGRLRLVVVDGAIEAVDVSEVPDAVRERVRALTAGLAGRRGLRLVDIERQLLLAGDTPGIALKSTLRAGKSTGGTILVIQAQHRYVTGSVGIDNTLAPALGRTVISTSLDVNSALGFGEAFYFRAFGNPRFGGDGGVFGDHPRVRGIGAGVAVPLGLDGLVLSSDVLESKTNPDSQAGFRQASTYDRWSTRLRYPWIRSRALTVSSEVSFDVTQEKVAPFGSAPGTPTISLDRARVVRFANDVVWQVPVGGILSARGILSFGLDAFGARSAGDAALSGLPLSRAGADASFQKFELAANYVRQIDDHFGFSIQGRTQTSFNQPMLRSEQFNVASLQELSAFDAGSLAGDSGWVVRGELFSPWRITDVGWPMTVTPYAYAATGSLHLENPTFFERRDTRLTSIGAGLRVLNSIDPRYSDLSLTLEVARGFRDDGIPNNSRFTFVGLYRF